MPATNTATVPPQPAASQPAPAPFYRVSDGSGTPEMETVVFLKTFGAWNRGVSAGFNKERASFLYQRGIARPFNPAVDRSGPDGFLVRK